VDSYHQEVRVSSVFAPHCLNAIINPNRNPKPTLNLTRSLTASLILTLPLTLTLCAEAFKMCGTKTEESQKLISDSQVLKAFEKFDYTAISYS